MSCTPRTPARPRSRTAFTLVELLVVIGIIALLISILLPSLAAAREQANNIKCANNFRSIGNSIRMFATDHKGRVPYTQCSPWGAPWWGVLMYSRDYFTLVDRYGADQRLFRCPSKTYADERDTATLYGWGGTDEVAARARADSIPSNIAGGDPNMPKFINELWGNGGLHDQHFVSLPYTYMGANGQAGPGAESEKANAHWVWKLEQKTRTGTAYDGNAPLMGDQTWTQRGNYYFNHGKRWTIPAFDTGNKKADAHNGDVKLNLLFVDGHVETKQPDLESYYASGDGFFFR